MPVTFRPRSPPASDDPFVEVERRGRIQGHIRISPYSGLYRYFPDLAGILDPVLEDADLETLKTMVIQALQSTP